MQVLQADYTWLNCRLVQDAQVVIDDNGWIVEVGRTGRPVTARLSNRALFPGFVSAHSHAFQRGLRGDGEHYPEDVGDFWSWREAMYGLVDRLSRDEFRKICRQAFEDMRGAGITTVGEFHYLHHDDRAARDFAFDELLLEAAAAADVRLVVLLTYYQTGGIGQALGVAQRRFETHRLEPFCQQLDRLAARVDTRTHSLGIAAHSIRAVPLQELKALHKEALDRELVFHMHLEEQPREIEECRAAFGASPLEIVLDALDVGSHFTGVHLTQAAPEPLERFIHSGGNVCVCPITEANLGDGLPDLPRMLARENAVCVGTDSNVRADMTEELRWLEYGQRLRGLRRGVARSTNGHVAEVLLRCGTINGARALGLAAGEIAPGQRADLVQLDLGCPELAGWRPDTLAAAWLFGAGRAAIHSVCVNGQWRP